jgi:sugar (pentulose or hexulose) kinase
MRELVESADGPVLGICASSASGNLLVTDKNGHPACPIVNWRDTRVGNEAFNILGKIDTEALYNRTGWPFDYRTFPLAQLCYIREHSPSIIDDAGTVCMSTEYLYYTLTGKWGISTSAGTPFYLIDQQKGTYISEILDALLIRENQLPPVFSCGSVLGCITHEASRAFNLPEGIPIVLGSFDHPSAARGAGVLKEGEILLSCGTSWVVFFPAVSRELLVKGKFLIDPFLSPGGCWGGMVSAAALSDNMEKYVHRYIDNSEHS